MKIVNTNQLSIKSLLGNILYQQNLKILLSVYSNSFCKNMILWMQERNTMLQRHQYILQLSYFSELNVFTGERGSWTWLFPLQQTFVDGCKIQSEGTCSHSPSNNRNFSETRCYSSGPIKGCLLQATSSKTRDFQISH